MTGRQEYDRTKDRQRTVDEYMVNNSAFRNNNRNNMTGRQDDRQDARQRSLDKYMIDMTDRGP